MPADISAVVARRLGLAVEQVREVVKRLDSGLNPAFIAHYRKAVIGGLDEKTVRAIAMERRRAVRLENLRAEVRRLAEAAGPVPPELAEAITQATEETPLEDMARPFRPARRTAASVAVERGLDPLAQYALQGLADGPDLKAKAVEFVNPAKEVYRPEDALAGAGHILAERMSNDYRLRAAVRATALDSGVLESQQAKRSGKGAAEFRGYFDFKEPLKHLPPHRVLAINRGERDKALKVGISVPRDELLAKALPLVAPADHRFADFLKAVLADAVDRLVLPAIEREVRRKITEGAEAHGIEVFADNLRGLLMAPPQQGLRVLALQPGFRSGCKVAVLDADGNLLGETIVYPFEPQSKRQEAKAALLVELRRHEVRAIAIGNGTGCRECEELVSELIEENALDLVYTIVNEAGAGVYADSPLAKQEFPNLEAAVCATISIGRRLQDPLKELVKIDPRAIGVGLYQHDVNQDRLREKLEATVQSCVCAVGADADAASPAMLRYLPGLGPPHVQSLVALRAQGPLTTREQLRALPNWDGKPFLQAAGFLRVRGPEPLDDTRIHPESYERARQLLAKIGHKPEDLKDRTARQAIAKSLTGVSLEPLAAELALPLLDLLDFVAALQRPQHDPRAGEHGPIFRNRIQRFEDFQPGMWVKGTVRNVVDFGAFVDIGLKEDGLVHISQFSKRYVRNPLKFLHVGDVVDVRIVSIDTARHRIALTLIPEEKPKKHAPSAAEGAAPPRAAKATAGSPAAVGGTDHPPAAPSLEHRPSRTPPHARSPRRVASGDRPAARTGGPGRDRKPGPTSGDRSARPPRKGGPRKHEPRRAGPKEPRVHTFRDEPQDKPDQEELDEKGRPKIRWAWYDSDAKDGEQPTEENDVE